MREKFLRRVYFSDEATEYVVPQLDDLQSSIIFSKTVYHSIVNRSIKHFQARELEGMG